MCIRDSLKHEGISVNPDQLLFGINQGCTYADLRVDCLLYTSHIEIIPAQRKRLGTKRGFIAVKSNCSLQSYVPALHQRCIRDRLRMLPAHCSVATQWIPSTCPAPS